MTEDEKNTVFGSPWEEKGFYDDYDSATEVKNMFLDMPTRCQAKVKRMSDGRYLVKVRDLDKILSNEKRNKKNGKSSKRNKKDTGERKFDPSASI